MFDLYEFTDDRAETVYRVALSAIDESLRTGDVARIISTRLPPALRFPTEISYVMQGRFKLPPVSYAETAKEVIQHRILEAAGTRHFVSSEELYAWFSREDNQPYFVQPPQETITITLNGSKFQSALRDDQLLGIAYGLLPLLGSFTSQSSLTNRELDWRKIINTAPQYTTALEPHLQIGQYQLLYLPTKQILYFSSPLFLQGLISAARWRGLPNNGIGTLWQDLAKHVRGGLEPQII